MLEINVFNEENIDRNCIDIPPDIDEYQYNFKSNKNYKIFYKNIKNITRNMLSIYPQLYCFYCGTQSSNIIPAYFHDNSGLNIWMWSDWRCSAIICEDCVRTAGKTAVNYDLRIKEVDPKRKGPPKNILLYEPDVLIPSIEPVQQHFEYHITGYLVAKTIRGEHTINKYSLNRKVLVRRRLKLIEYISDILENEGIRTNADLLSLLEGNNKFINIKTYVFSTPLDILFLLNLRPEWDDKFFFTNLIKIINNKSKLYVNVNSKIHYAKSFILVDESAKKGGRIFTDVININKFNFNGIRGFDNNLSIEFRGKNDILLLGENGVGKSTLLSLLQRAIKYKAKLSLKEFIDDVNSNTFIEVEYDEDGKKYRIDKHKVKVGTKIPHNFIEISESRVSDREVEKLINLINKNENDKKLIDWIFLQIKVLIPIPSECNLIHESRNVFWIDPYSQKRVYLNLLSSGFKSILTIFYLIVSEFINKSNDFPYKSLMTGLSNSIVVIDEIELHLHPNLKKKIIKVLKNVFPEVIFIMTTHDPLVIKSADNTVDIIVLNKDKNNRTYLEKDLPDHSYLTTEQILTSPIFGMSSINDDEENTVAKYDLALSEGDWEYVSKLRKKLSKSGYFGSSYRELIALSVVDVYLSKKEKPDDAEIAKVLEKLRV